jgi:DNA polymerase-1
MGQGKLSNSLGVSTLEANEILRTYYKKYPVREYLSRTVSELYRTGSVKVTINRPLLTIHREYRVPHELSYKAVNIIIQGTAAYVMKAGMLRTWKWIKRTNLYPGIRLLLTVHDELIFEIPNKYAKEQVVPILTELMADKTTFKVPIIASPKVSDKSWGDCKEWRNND